MVGEVVVVVVREVRGDDTVSGGIADYFIVGSCEIVVGLWAGFLVVFWIVL